MTSTSRSHRKRRNALVRNSVFLTDKGMQDDRQPGSILYIMNGIAGREGVRVRRGAELRATLDGKVTCILYHTSGNVFACDDGTNNALYDVTTPASPTVTPDPMVYGYDETWAGIEFTTSAGGYLIATTDGADVVWVFDGTRWEPLSAVAPEYIPVNFATLADYPTKWTPGQVVTGGTSGQTATVVGFTTEGLWIINSSGAFQAGGEVLTTAAGGTITSTATQAAGPSAWTMTGPTYGQVSRPFIHGERLWYIEPGAQAAWYMAAGAFAGAATRFSLAGVFKKGGTLMAGGPLSSDSGSGMQTRCAFISTRGEVAIYEGLDPATWSLVGLYNVGAPFGHNAITQVGGDITVLTQDGLTSLLTAIFAPRGTDKATEIMEPVRGFWRWMVESYGENNWTTTWWPEQGYYMISPNGELSGENTDNMVVTDEGQWSLFNGWAVTATLVYLNGMIFGTPDGEVANAEKTGKDFDTSYRTWVAVMVPGPAATRMQMRRGRCMCLALEDPNTYVWSMSGADLEETPGGGVAPAGGTPPGVWGSAVWGTDVWGVSGGPNWQTYYDWQGLSARGHECLIGASILTNSDGIPKAVMQRLDWIAEIGDEPW